MSTLNVELTEARSQHVKGHQTPSRLTSQMGGPSLSRLPGFRACCTLPPQSETTGASSRTPRGPRKKLFAG